MDLASHRFMSYFEPEQAAHLCQIAVLESFAEEMLVFEIETDETIRKDAYLFGEGQSRVVVSTSSEKAFVIENICKEFGVPVNVLGVVTEGLIKIDGENFGSTLTYKELYDNAIGKYMEEMLTDEQPISSR